MSRWWFCGADRPSLSVAAVLLAVATTAPSPVRGSDRIQAYSWPPSVAQGEQVGLYISSPAGPVRVDVFREGAVSAPVFSTVLSGVGVQPVPPGASSAGCGWSPSVTLNIPPFWSSGMYTVRGSAPGVADGWAVFVVREAAPGSTADILVQSSLTTWQAYNAWGGKSLYDYNSSDSVPAAEVSFRRPYDASDGKGQLPFWELPFIRWLEGSGYRVEYCAGPDLDRDPTLLSHYRVFVSVGHDEYWSKPMRDQVEAFVTGGGNAAFFSGNVCWWQVRFSDGGDRMICYKSRKADPLTGVDDSRVTVNWIDVPVLRPENSMTGVGTAAGGYVDSHGWYPASEGWGGYTAYRTGHWVYAGTGLTDGAVFGTAATIVGYETDGALFTWEGGLPVVTGTDRTPMTFRILGLSPASNGHATMGVYEYGGTVFTAATTDWAQGLAGDPTVARITRNVLDALDGVSGVLVNDPPLVVPPGDMTSAPERSIDVRLTVLDPELGTLSYVAAGLPPGLAIDAATGEIAGSIASDAEAKSPYATRVTATDDGSPPLSTTVSWMWTVDGRVGVGDDPAAPRTRLMAPEPNPARAGSEIRFELAAPAAVLLTLRDIQGRTVRVLDNGTVRDAGIHRVRWDGHDDAGLPVAPGIYFLALEAGTVRAAGKLAVLR